MKIHENKSQASSTVSYWKCLKMVVSFPTPFSLPFLFQFQFIVWFVSKEILLTTSICTAVHISTNISLYPYDSSMRRVLSFSFCKWGHWDMFSLCWLGSVPLHCHNHHGEYDYMLSPASPLSKSLSLGVVLGDLPDTDTYEETELRLRSSRTSSSRSNVLHSRTHWI